MENGAGNMREDLLGDLSSPGGLSHALFEHGNDGVLVYSVGPDGMPECFVAVNERVCTLLDYSREEVLALSPGDLFVAADGRPIPEDVRRTWASGDRGGSETTLAAKGGDLLEVEVSDHSFEAAGRQLTASIIRDRTEANRAERQRARAVAVCNSTLNSMIDMVSVHDKDFRIVKANRALTDFLGLEQHEIEGKLCYEVFHDIDGEWPGCPHGETMRTGKSASLVLEDPRRGVSLEVRCTPFLDEKGALYGSVHTVRNVTALQEAEREKDRLIAELRLALGDVKRLSGLLPICCQCKKIRDREGNWTQLELYIRERTDAEFTHGYCPECFEKARPLNGAG